MLNGCLHIWRKSFDKRNFTTASKWKDNPKSSSNNKDIIFVSNHTTCHFLVFQIKTLNFYATSINVLFSFLIRFAFHCYFNNRYRETEAYYIVSLHVINNAERKAVNWKFQRFPSIHTALPQEWNVKLHNLKWMSAALFFRFTKETECDNALSGYLWQNKMHLKGT